MVALRSGLDTQQGVRENGNIEEMTESAADRRRGGMRSLHGAQPSAQEDGAEVRAQGQAANEARAARGVSARAATVLLSVFTERGYGGGMSQLRFHALATAGYTGRTAVALREPDGRTAAGRLGRVPPRRQGAMAGLSVLSLSCRFADTSGNETAGWLANVAPHESDR